MSLREPVKLSRYRGHVVITKPHSEPMTASTLRDHLKESGAGLPDDEANSLIAEARQMIEDSIGVSFLTQTWRLALDQWPAGNGPWWDGVRQGAIVELQGVPRAIELPRWPLQSLAAVRVFDQYGNPQTVNTSATFDLDTYQTPGRLALKFGQTWPIALRDINAIEIDYVSGYGSSGAAVPPTLLRSLKLIAAYLYSHRGDDCSALDALGAAGSTLSQFRVKRL
jgi:hypothetical protein